VKRSSIVFQVVCSGVAVVVVVVVVLVMFVWIAVPQVIDRFEITENETVT